jgi:hypothetical protein
MYDLNMKRQFIELRAKGWSLSHIATRYSKFATTTVLCRMATLLRPLLRQTRIEPGSDSPPTL